MKKLFIIISILFSITSVILPANASFTAAIQDQLNCQHVAIKPYFMQTRFNIRVDHRNPFNSYSNVIRNNISISMAYETIHHMDVPFSVVLQRRTTLTWTSIASRNFRTARNARTADFRFDQPISGGTYRIVVRTEYAVPFNLRSITVMFN